MAFPSRDTNNIGTIGLAQRQWKSPLRKRGFVVNAHGSPSIAMLRRAYGEFDMSAQFELTGTARIVWDYTGTLDVSAPQSDAEIATESDRCHNSLELRPTRWGLITTGATGKKVVIATGALSSDQNRTVRIIRSSQAKIALSFGGAEAWQGSVPRAPQGCDTTSGLVGWWLAPRSHLKVDRFAVSGALVTHRVSYGPKSAILGAGENIGDWIEVRGASPSIQSFKSKQSSAIAKWNVSGRKFTLWGPRGPNLGVVEVVIDGRSSAKLDLRSDVPRPSQPI